jgi:hypothetical protein
MGSAWTRQLEDIPQHRMFMHGALYDVYGAFDIHDIQ